MTTLRAAHHQELVSELTPLVLGALVRDVDPLPPHDLLVVVQPKNDERVLRLRVSADPECGRVHLAIGSVARHKGPVGPFFRTTKDVLEGARLEGLSLVAGDRVVRLDFAKDGERYALIAELFGRHANLVLAKNDSQRPTIAAVLHAPKEGTRASERLAIGGSYASGGGTPKPEEVEPLAALLPAIETDKQLAKLAPLSWRVEASLGKRAEERLQEERRADLVRRLERRQKTTRSRLAGLERQALVANDVERLAQDAELLKSALGTLKRGMKSVELVDWFSPDQAKRTIALEAKLTPKENLDRLFARVKKLERTRDQLPYERGLCEAELEGLAELLDRARTEDPDVVEAEAIQSGWLKRRQAENERAAKHKKQTVRLPYRSFTGLRGSEIRVGRSAKDNDRLTTREARGNDLWFHTADTPGSHVVLRVTKGKPVDDEEILDACTLAVHFSPLKNATRARVHVAPIKHVKKPKGVPAGTVTLSGGKVREIRMEPARLKRLLDKNSPRR